MRGKRKQLSERGQVKGNANPATRFDSGTEPVINRCIEVARSCLWLLFSDGGNGKLYGVEGGVGESIHNTYRQARANFGKSCSVMLLR